MAPVKFEDNLKEKLEKRNIQPSEMAWGKLESRLDESATTSSKKRFWIVGIAASLVGILLVSTLFFKKEIKPVEENSIVISEQEIKTQVEPENTTKEKPNPEVIKDDKLVKEPSIQIASENTVEQTPKQKPEIQEKPQTEIALEIPENAIEVKQPQTFEEIKVNEVVAKVEELVKQNQTVTEEDINTLLQLAQQEIKQQRIYDQTTGRVDAMALLQDVEADLDQSFRDKVFEALLSNVENVATAIVKRNE